ncbi:carbon-nitrogen hydrolase [Salinibacterium xinjiangense]|uniref:nitrilase-related carbon-nitrogen hydrolase n=1 Tax=Salinibacterium xinjiangense TaxID=386302 RepID=UPI000BE27710|nr:nitrilase-related carbon-nitrogen hydrolase [Salinibacterium xinjiangense]GGK92634.1 carbon-nitrogen hydrolase [Salinibacterium xinjiangense]
MFASTAPDAPRDLVVRAVELAPILGDLSGNIGRITEAIAQAVSDGVQLLVLPELATTGYYLVSREAALAASLRTDAPQFTRWAAMLAPDTVVVVGFAERRGDIAYNSAAVLSSGGLLALYRKVHLWDEEKSIFAAGDETQPVVETPLGRIGVLICYDLEFPEVPRSLALRGAELLVVPTNWPLLARPEGEHPPEVIQAMAAARASAIPVVCCDRCGIEAGKLWTEGTTIIGSDGWAAGVRNSHVVTATVTLNAGAGQIGPRNHVIADRRPNHYAALVTGDEQ